MNKISTYILTKNSEKYLAKIIDKLIQISDEILIIDSGSSDKTESIAKSYGKTKFYYNEFKNFKDQRLFAEKSCSNDMILFLDSDEIPNSEFIECVKKIKENGFEYDAYSVTRVWNVLGKNVHSIYPVVSPDYPVRLYNRNKVSFRNSNLVHESLSGFDRLGSIGGTIYHYTFETKDELYRKLELYTDIAARDLILRNKKIKFYKIIFNPIAAFIKWYFFKKGYKDGQTGFILGKYAYLYTL